MTEINSKQERVILPPPPFTLKDLRDAIPPHLFESSLPRSLGYLVQDIVYTLIVTFVTIQLLKVFPAWVVFPVYTIVQGSVWFAFWILAHECGHGAFSKYQFVNDCIGLVLHSFLLVPYHSWRLTHATHHKATNHVDIDTAFPPDIGYVPPENIFASIFKIGGYLTIGLPCYLLFNTYGQKYDGWWVNHFNPSAPMFQPRDKLNVIISDIGIAAVVFGIVYSSMKYGFCAVFCWYLAPYMVVNAWLVLITYLQHTDTRIPKYNGDDFTFLRGGLGTIDRDYGICNKLFHHITDSHVVHHIFSTMPFYNAIEATPYAKKMLGKYYLSDDRSIALCMWESFRYCKFIEKGTAELWRHAN
eukprot:PhF_6_TR38910/c0_g1_i1/m.58208/K10256/FAD2; omega-6 fatty acid desaturase / acyl-lipid omega-6 desaturase (Delta-12 desaturase)